MNKSETHNIKPIHKKDRTRDPFCDESQKRNSITNVLIVDNDQESTRFLLEILARKDICGTVAANKKTAVDFLDKYDYDLVFSVTHMDQPKDGFKLVHEIKANSPEMPVIMIAEAKKRKGQNPQQIAETVIEAIRAGCCDFLIKPLNRQKIEALLDTSLPNHNVHSCDMVQNGTRALYRIVGRSLKLARTVDLAKKIAPTSAPVLVSGESGTGKELISFLIHHHSKRALGPYVKVNCAALSDSLLESELFGHEKGAFTGAYTQRKGRFEMAHGGTLLLDEITETPIKFQAKLLRVLEQQDFERVGGNDSIRVDVRIISTTNKDLLQEVAEGRFRQDLYYRLCGVRLIVPPLKQRSEDLPDLVWHFVNVYARQVQRHITKLDSAMMNIFAKYHWPGNIRQLRNVVLTSLILGNGPNLSLADVSWLFDELQPLPQENNLSISNGQTPVSGLAGMPLNQVERQAILDTLDQTGGNQTKAAKILGISDRTLRGKIHRYRQEGVLQLA
ncbi:MAG: sigma-54-dependent Fis family transcriptional regulator [Planctomycetes bacterium]|nr:sigma-54-dependent Fis family transcriptional regulator [Planctomycetota bacterium]